jgi:hypothetical protein
MYCHLITVTRGKVWIGNWIYWTRKLVTENNEDGNLSELHIPNIIVTAAHIKTSQSSLANAY